MKKVLRFLTLFLALTLIVSLITPVSLASDFVDTKGHWAKKYIEEGVQSGYISGYSDGSFRPNNSVTRGAFCKILNKALGLQATANISFSDVKSTDAFYGEIQKAVYAGYISGYSDNTFRANKTISRQEAAVMLSRVITSPASLQSLSKIKDSASVASYAKQGVQAVMSKGYLAGDSNRHFNPNSPMTRAQTAKVISTLLGGEKVVHGSIDFKTSGKTYSNNIYVGPLTVNVPASGNLSFQNCQLLGTLTVKTKGQVNLINTDVEALTVNAPGGTTINASGTSAVKNTYLASGANLTESRLTGTGFQTVSLSGSSLKTEPVVLRGAFQNVTVSSPVTMNVASGSVTALNVSSGAAGTSFALAGGTTVTTATLNGLCSFTGTGKITTAVQNVAGVTYKTLPGKITGTAANTLVPTTITPANGMTDVAVTTAIKLQFQQALYNSKGTALTTANVMSNVLELRSGGASGTKVTFTAVVSTDRKTITVTPKTVLQGSTTYYVILLANGLRNASGTSASRQEFSFKTTTTTLTPTISPVNGATNVAVTVRPTLTFSEDLYSANYTGWISASNVLSSAFRLYRGSVANSHQVSMTPTLNGRVVTLTPTENLTANTTYTIVMNEGYLKNSAGTTNTYQTFSFTTGAAATLTPTVSPVNGATNVAVTVRPTLTFSEDFYSANYTGWISASNVLSSAFRLYRGSVANSHQISMTPTLSGRVVTLTPTENLTTNTTYTIVMNEGYLKNSAGTTNTYQTFSFTTGATATLTPTVSPVNGATNVAVTVRPTLTFSDDLYSANYTGWISASNVLSSAFRLYRDSVSNSHQISMTPTLSGRVVTLIPTENLTTNTTYTIVMNEGYLKNSAGTTNTYQTFTFTTGAANTLMPTVSPVNGATNVAVTVRPTLTFSDDLYAANYTGWTSASYVLSSAFQLYRGSVSNNSQISMTPTLSGRVVTLSPTGGLAANTTYTIVMNAGYLKNSAGTTNTYQTFTFTTGAANTLMPTVSPVNGTTNVAVTVRPTLTFSDDLYAANYTGWISASSILSSAFRLYRGSVANSNQVSMTQTLSGRVVTLIPTENLAANTTYIIVMNAGFLKNNSGTTNTYQTFIFTTGAAAIPTVTLASASSNFAPDGTVSLQFSTPVSLASGTATNYLNLYQNGTTWISCAVSFANNGTTATLKPSVSLANNTRYTVSVSGNIFYNVSGSYVAATTLNFTTSSAAVIPSVTNIAASGAAQNSLAISFTSNVAGTADVYLKKPGGTTDQHTTLSNVQIGSNTTSAFTGLEPNTAYTAVIILTPTGGTAQTFSGTISTLALALTVTVGAVASTDGTSATVTLNSNCDGTVQLTCSGSAASFSANNFPVSANVPVSLTLSGLTPGTTYPITATLTGTNGTATGSANVTMPSSACELTAFSATPADGQSVPINSQDLKTLAVSATSGSTIPFLKIPLVFTSFLFLSRYHNER